MNVFADFHHSGLYHSISRLFEKRLKGTLYSPCGMEWFEKGYWKYSDDMRITKEYLEGDPDKIHGQGWLAWDRYEPIKVGDNEFSIVEAGERFVVKRITLDQFKKMEFDYILPTVYNNEVPFIKLRDQFQPKAKMLRNFGNADDVTSGKIPNLLNSTIESPWYPDFLHRIDLSKFNVVTWRQEINTDVFCWTPPPGNKVITSLLAGPKCALDSPTWDHHKQALWEFKWMQHGTGGDQGRIPESDVPNAFKRSDFVWHVKFRGDGYGHTIHHAYATGRPCIVRGSYYKECIAEPFLVHDYSCIDLEKENYQGFLKKMRYWAEPDHLLEMSKNAYGLFKKHVNFDKEFEDVKAFLARAV